jgi:LmbE family N-acetylglucosaminyl deacetylase
MPDYHFMACFAHPDDETFSCGGLFAHYRQRGIRSTLVCATRGEAGEISDPALGDKAELGQIRTQELLEATGHMGVDDVIFLGHRDSGMAGSPDNHLPAAYARVTDSAVVHRLVHLMRSLRPQVVVTFDPTGGYGHPDHIAIHRHAVAAFHAAADASFSPHLGAP